MIIAVASGKGGTGKTTVSVSLALSLENVQFVDCDVEEPNAAIFLQPVIAEKNPVTMPVPERTFSMYWIHAASFPGGFVVSNRMRS